MKLTIEDISTVSGMPLGDVRAAYEILIGGPLTPPSELASAGDAAVLLTYTSLVSMGYPRDRLLPAIKYYKGMIADRLTKGKGVLVIQDARYVVFDNCEDAFDITESKSAPFDSVPMPVLFAGVAVPVLYSRTVETIERQRSLVASAQSGSASPTSES